MTFPLRKASVFFGALSLLFCFGFSLAGAGECADHAPLHHETSQDCHCLCHFSASPALSGLENAGLPAPHVVFRIALKGQCPCGLVVKEIIVPPA